jgi:hypothetical protein
MKLSALILSFSVLIWVLSGCTDYDPPYFYETVAMTLSNADNSGESVVSAGDSVSKYAYAIQLNLTFEPRDHEGADSYESEFKNEDTVTDLFISCSETFNGIPSNQSLNHLFNGRSGYHGYELTTSTYTSLFQSSSPGVQVPESWTSSNYLLLMVPPAAEGTYTFHVSGTFSDGRVLSDSVTVKLYE